MQALQVDPTTDQQSETAESEPCESCGTPVGEDVVTAMSILYGPTNSYHLTRLAATIDRMLVNQDVPATPLNDTTLAVQAVARALGLTSLAALVEAVRHSTAGGPCETAANARFCGESSPGTGLNVCDLDAGHKGLHDWDQS